MVASTKGLGPENDCAGEASNNCKRQTRPLVREGAHQKQDRNCQTVIYMWSWAPNGARHQDLLTDWLTVSRNVTLTWLWLDSRDLSCGGGVDYLCRSPASRRRRQKEKSRMRGSKIWLRVPRDSDPRTTALARTSSNCKRKTRPLVRDSAPQKQTRNCLIIIKIWS
jgi:hypothetical protein